jgi:adenylosuccinate synthase
MSLYVLLDAGYGDSGKGKIVNEWARRGYLDMVADGGVGPSAAHCVHYEDRQIWYGQVPSGWLGQATELLIGPGVLVDHGQLMGELDELCRFEVDKRLRIDPRCGLLFTAHRSADATRHFEGGCASARSEQLLGRLSTAADTPALAPYLRDVPVVAADALRAGRTVLVAGSHGHGYDPYRAPQRKQATAEPCGSAAALCRAGISGSWSPIVLAVVGAVTTTVLPDIELDGELDLAAIEARGLLSHGRVSGLRRRVASTPQWSVLDDFVALERPAALVIGRADEYDSACRGGTTARHLTAPVKSLIDRIERRTGTAVIGISTGPRAHEYVELTDFDWGAS